MRAVPKQEASELLAGAIRAQGSADFAAALARWLGAVIAHDNITMLAYVTGRAPLSLYRTAADPSVHANFDRVYVAGAYLLDPFHDLHARGAPSGLYRLSEIAPDQFHRNPYFRDYYAGTTLIDEIGFVCCPAPGVSVHLCLGRDASSNARFPAREIERARAVAPVAVALAEREWAGLAAERAPAETAVTAQLIDALQRERGIRLSQRQAEVALLILRGHSSTSIGLQLGISAQTVKVFRKQLYRKCAISSQAELFTMLLPLLGA